MARRCLAFSVSGDAGCGDAQVHNDIKSFNVLVMDAGGQDG